MVSNLYTPKEFYEKQKLGKLAKNNKPRDKLKKDDMGYFLWIKERDFNGKFKYVRQRLKAGDYVYNRNSGVTKYNREADKKRVSKTKLDVKKGTKKYIRTRHKGDISLKGL